VGCDGGTPLAFDYHGIQGGFESLLNGQFTITGTANNNQTVVDGMLDAINGVFQGTKQCSQKTTQQCPGIPGLSGRSERRESGPVASGCHSVTLTQCMIVNFMQATVFDSESHVEAQITINGSSEPDEGFECDTVLGLINGALTGLPPTLLLLEPGRRCKSFATLSKITELRRPRMELESVASFLFSSVLGVILLYLRMIISLS
jgi:hypothetical protein